MTENNPAIIYDNHIPSGGRIVITDYIYLFNLPNPDISFDEKENKWAAFCVIGEKRTPVVEFWSPKDVPDFEEEHFYGVLAGIEAAFSCGLIQGRKEVQGAAKSFFRALSGDADISPFLNAADEVP